MIDVALSALLSRDDRDDVEEALSSSGFPWEWAERPPIPSFEVQIIVADPTTEAVIEWVVATLEAVLRTGRTVALTFGGGDIRQATYDLGTQGHELVMAAHRDYEEGAIGLRKWDPDRECWETQP